VSGGLLGALCRGLIPRAPVAVGVSAGVVRWVGVLLRLWGGGFCGLSGCAGRSAVLGGWGWGRKGCAGGNLGCDTMSLAVSELAKEVWLMPGT
jgi:hypothetical protein